MAKQLYREGNFRISANQSAQREVPYYFLIATGGGFTEGEHYVQKIHLGRDAAAHLTTQTPTCVFKCPHGETTSQDIVIALEDGACLSYCFDELLPYEYAIYRQRTNVKLGRGATLILCDGVTGGWSRTGKPFSYTKLDLCLTAERSGRFVLRDHLFLDPVHENFRDMGLFGEETNYNSVTILNEKIDQETLKRMREAVEEEQKGIYSGISLLPEGGITLRALGSDPDRLHRLVWAFVCAFRERELGLPHWQLRKPNFVNETV
ncbi:MAG: urease accessory protein UreD [Lachnospiraceae bacterium]